MKPDLSAHGSLFLTGGTGFIGRHLVAALSGSKEPPLFTLTRSSPAEGAPAVARLVHGDLEAPASYAPVLPGVRQVLHLAARTGRGHRSEFYRVNVEGTRALLRACRDAGVPRFIFVSSIAATYAERTGYAYAESKRLAEQEVAASGLEFLIVRPTIVAGRDSPPWRKLGWLAGLPVLPLFGNGRARAQPIDVADVVSYLLAMLAEPVLPNRAVDLGGPEVVSMEQLLRRMRRFLRGRESPLLHLPGRFTIRCLAGVERVLGPVLPVGAGQLAVFVNDSLAGPDPGVDARRAGMTDLEAMIRFLDGHG